MLLPFLPNLFIQVTRHWLLTMRHSITAIIAIAVLFTSPAIGQAFTIIDVPG